MHTSCDLIVIRTIHRILTGASHDHPAAPLIALTMGDRDDLFGAVPQPWSKTKVEPTVWCALGQAATRNLKDKPGFQLPSKLHRAALHFGLTLTHDDAQVLAFTVAQAQCSDLDTLVELLSDDTGLTQRQVKALCLGLAEATVDKALTGQLAQTGLIWDEGPSRALLLGLALNENDYLK